MALSFFINIGFNKKLPSLLIKLDLIPDMPLIEKSFDFNKGKNFLTLLIICLLDILLYSSLIINCKYSLFSIKFFIPFISESFTKLYIFGKNSFKFVFMSYPYCEETGQALGPISLFPLDLIIQWGSKNGNS